MELGRVVITASAQEALSSAHTNVGLLLDRHRHGDWGDLPLDGRVANDRAVLMGEEVASEYPLESGGRCLILTDGGRTLTAVLTPQEMPLLLVCLPQERESVLRRRAGALPLPPQVAAPHSVPGAAPRPRFVPERKSS